MRRRGYAFAVLTVFLLAACGTAQETAQPEELVVLTDTAPEETEGSAETESLTEAAAALPAEMETETETETVTETELVTEPEDTGDKPPQLLHEHEAGRYYVTVELGDHRDLSELISYGDDHDPHPTMTWEGSYDPDEPGEYPITVTLTDSAGNRADYDVTVCVPWETITASVSFDTLLSQNLEGSCGIDVSKWQGDIDFTAVKNAGAEFVLMRIGYGDSGCEMDETFTQNLANAKAAGLQVGVYFYSTAGSAEAAEKQADWVASQLDGETLDFPVAYDWENFSHFQDWGMSFAELNAVYDAFRCGMETHGYDTMLYAEPQTLGTAWTTADKTIWLADYGAEADYTGDYYMRQCGNTGRIDGIDGDVDLNVLNRD